tara:strand:+ start:667 stop:1650 length:984 start_codon:yes stop_codon:yes gene_type:complete
MENKEVRKIAIRAPDLIPEQIATFGAIRYLKSQYPEAFIEVICTAGMRNIFDYQVDVDKLHEIEQSKDSVLGVFPWIHNNNNLFGFDTFIDFHGGAAAATMGIALKTARRVAYSTSMTKPMLTHFIKAEEKSEFLDSAYLKLCSLVTESEYPQSIHAQESKPSEKENVQLQALGDYIFLGIRASEWGRHKDIWSKIIDDLDEISFVVFLEQDLESLEALEYLRSKKSERFFLIEKSFARTDLLFMNSSKGIITDSLLYGNLASFQKIKSVVLAFDLHDYPSYETYTPRPDIIVTRNNSVSVHINDEGAKVDITDSETADLIVKVFHL